MGLDTVELVMEVEETFDIQIQDEVAQGIVTVGDLYDCVVSKLELAHPGKCLSAATFYEIRDSLRKVGVEKRFGPSTQLDAILPTRKRRALWSMLVRESGLKLPMLVRPTWVLAINIFGSVIAAVICGSRLDSAAGEAFGVVILMLALAFCALSFVLTMPLATRSRPSWSTFRGLSETVLGLNVERMKTKHGPMGPNDVWVILRKLIVEQLAVEPDEVIREANFVTDLGCS